MLAQLSMLCLFFTEWPAPTTPALRQDLVGNKERPRGTCVGAMRVDPPTQGVTWIFLSVYFLSFCPRQGTLDCSIACPHLFILLLKQVLGWIPCTRFARGV